MGALFQDTPTQIEICVQSVNIAGHCFFCESVEKSPKERTFLENPTKMKHYCNCPYFDEKFF